MHSLNYCIPQLFQLARFTLCGWHTCIWEPDCYKKGQCWSSHRWRIYHAVLMFSMFGSLMLLFRRGQKWNAHLKCVCRATALLNISIVFLTFSMPLPLSSLLKAPIVSMCSCCMWQLFLCHNSQSHPTHPTKTENPQIFTFFLAICMI